MIEMLSSDYPITVICDVLDCAGSSYYYRSEQVGQTDLKAAIEKVGAEWPTYGYRRITAQLHRQGWSVNRKRIRRLMREMGLQVKTKSVVGIWGGVWTSLLPWPPYNALLLSTIRKSITPVRASNMRLQLTFADSKRSAHKMADVGQAWQNGYAERLLRTIKEEEVDLSDYRDYTDALRQLAWFLDEVYMHERIHSSLGYLTPAEFESDWLAEQSAKEVVYWEGVKIVPGFWSAVHDPTTANL
jgi:putative transposase